MRAAAYARYSTANQTDNSIQAQLTAIRAYLEREGHELVDIYADTAASATNTDRPEFRRMMSDARAGRFEAVVVYDVSRGSRDVSDWFAFRKAMAACGITVLSATEHLGDITNPNDFLSELITVGLGQHMVLQTRQKSIAGSVERAREGAFLGGFAPMGYEIRDGVYVVQPHEAEIVRQIYRRYADGDAYAEIIDYLRATGVKSRRGRSLDAGAVRTILCNERYIGVYSWHKRRVKYMTKWAGGAPNPAAVRIEGAIEPIIDTDLWERVRRRMSGNAHGNSRHNYLLSGLVTCSACGAAFIGKTNTNSRGYVSRCYVCGNKHRGGGCRARNVNADELETAVIAKISEYLRGLDYGAIADEVIAAWRAHDNKAATDDELCRLEGELSNCTRAIREGIDYPRLREEVTRINARISELRRNADAPATVSREEIIEILRRDAANITPDNAPRLVRAYVERITVSDTDIVIYGGVTPACCAGEQ